MTDADGLLLNSGWLAKKRATVEWTGEQLSSTNHPHHASAKGWLPAVVPGTVLTTLVKNEVFPEPFYGINSQHIPDIGAVGREYYTYWFCKELDVPQVKELGRVWLHFRGINYSAEIFVSGQQIPLQQPRGMFLRRQLDITDAVKSGGTHHLSVLVHPPDHPGRVEGGGQGGDHDIAKDVTAQYVEGWDWIIPIRDRNTGIWDEVRLQATGPAVIRDPHLVASFPHASRRSAWLHISVDVLNASPHAVHGRLVVVVSRDTEEGEWCLEKMLEEEVEIGPGGRATHTFTPVSIFRTTLAPRPSPVASRPSPLTFHPVLFLWLQSFFPQVELWWPNGMGAHPLYSVEVALEVEGWGESDSWRHDFGFRDIQSHIDPLSCARAFSVNGCPLFVRGGNWIVSDAMLRLSRPRYETEVAFHADAHLNMIRVWGGALAERPAFYSACDRRGLLVWQDLWITGDCNGRGVAPSNNSWPLDHPLFLACVHDTVKLLRNHASLALWVGGNEVIPAPDLNDRLLRDFAPSPPSPPTDPSLALDGTRMYIPGSLWGGLAAGDGSWSDGPYGIQNLEDYFSPGFYRWGFNPEIGSVGVPEAATMRSTMPPDAWDIPQIHENDEGEEVEMPHPAWQWHAYIAYSAPGKVPHQLVRYGRPRDLDDFCQKAQVVNYEQYRALVEAWNSRMWKPYTGMLIWKTQNPWPGLRGQLYDYQLDVCGGLFGVQRAAEPLHAQLNLYTRAVEVVNSSREAVEGAVLSIHIYSPHGLTPSAARTVEGLQVAPFSCRAVEVVPHCSCPPAAPVYFLRLLLRTGSGKVVSRNLYWLHRRGGDFSSLDGPFRQRKIRLQCTASSRVREGECVAHVCLTNGSMTAGQAPAHTLEAGRTPTKGCLAGSFCRSSEDEVSCVGATSGVAFFVRMSVEVEDGRGGSVGDGRVLGVRYSDNYVSVVPGETVEVTLRFDMPAEGRVRVVMRGWNVEEQVIGMVG